MFKGIVLFLYRRAGGLEVLSYSFIHRADGLEDCSDCLSVNHRAGGMEDHVVVLMSLPKGSLKSKLEYFHLNKMA